MGVVGLVMPSRKSDAGAPSMSVLTMLASTAAACRCGLAGVAQLRRHHSLQGVPHRRGRAHSLINGAGWLKAIPRPPQEGEFIVTMFAARTTRRLLKRTKRHEIGRVSRGAVCPPADGSPRVFFMVFFEYQRKKMVRK